MHSRPRQRRLSIGLGLTLLATAAAADEFDCPVTPGAVGKLENNNFARSSPWLGSAALAVLAPPDGLWNGMSRAHNFRNKQWWWSDGYRPGMERDLKVSGRRLDGDSPPACISRPTNAYNDQIDQPWYAMLVMVEFPNTGCWEITGEYRGEHLRLVVAVRDTAGQQAPAEEDRGDRPCRSMLTPTPAL